jgi:hypothetical protein
MVKISPTDLAELKRKIEKGGRGIRGALGAAMHAEGLRLMNKSVKLAPVDTGRMRATQFVAPPENRNRPKVRLGYGTDYAIYVHEIQGLHHPTGQANFLRQPMEQAMAGYADRLAKRTWLYMQRGTEMEVNTATPKKPHDKGRAWQERRRKALSNRRRKQTAAAKKARG